MKQYYWYRDTTVPRNTQVLQTDVAPHMELLASHNLLLGIDGWTPGIPVLEYWYRYTTHTITATDAMMPC